MEQPKCEYCKAAGHDNPADCCTFITKDFRALCTNHADMLGIAVSQF